MFRNVGSLSVFLCCALAAGCGTTRPVQRFQHGDGLAISAAFSSDGALLAAVSEDQVVRVWDVSSGRELARAGVTGRISPSPRGYTLDGISFSPDDQSVAFAVADGAVVLWEWRRSDSLRPVLKLDVPVRQVAFSEDARSLAAVGGGMESAAPETPVRLLPVHCQMIDLGSGNVVANVRDDECGALAAALSADGERVAIICLIDNEKPVRHFPIPMTATAFLSVRDVRTGDELTRIVGVGNPFPVFSDDGRYLLAGEKVVDLHEAKVVSPVPITARTFSRDSRKVLGLQEGVGVNWELMPTRPWIRLVRTDVVTGHTSRGRKLVLGGPGDRVLIPVRPAFSPDRRHFVDYHLNLWRLPL